MSAVTATWEPWGRAMTLDELDALPDDGRRHELIDGTLLVTPAPSLDHQGVLGRLFLAVHAAATPDLRVIFAPADVRVGVDTNLQPDLLVTEDASCQGQEPASTAAARGRSAFAEHQAHRPRAQESRLRPLGTSSYWMVDPMRPSITAWELVDGGYVEAGHAEGDEPLVLERPFPVRIVPQELVP